MSDPDTCLHGLTSCEQCAHAFGPQWSGDELDTRQCTHAVSLDLYCADCDAESYDPYDAISDRRREYADSVGMPLHDKI